MKKVVLAPVDWVVYTVLNERQRKALTDIFTEEQKQQIKRILSGRKQAQRQKLKQIKYHLYNLGFTEKALEALEDYYTNMKDPQLKRLAAWELTLWHANQYTKEGAGKALEYIEAVKNGEKDADQLRRIAIVQAECYETCHEVEKGKEVIHGMLPTQKHADLYLAAANLEGALDKRMEWVNKVMELYGLQPIGFTQTVRSPVYDDLQTIAMDRKIEDGPKVSVILPAFKAEEGIRVAIESILSQTWQNIELLAVDDCSPDNTAKVIAEYAEKDSRVKALSTPVNSGPYVARNIALEHATGDFVTINDADDWSHAEKIEIQVKHLIEHEHIIANTSEHSRLTEEELKLYRRGTPGKYIFPNMSSIMFRRKPVLEKVGYWDSVRFAADGEFKRRLIKVFGKNSYVDLKTGPLSLPRQSVTSLTGSSAFGYNGFFMGVRKEYVEALEYHHNTAETLRYPFPMTTRVFQVPEPMWPKREEKAEGKRFFDVVIATDFRTIDEEQISYIKEFYARKDGRIGLVQINQYNAGSSKTIKESIRNMLDGDRLQMLVYGEQIQTDQLIVWNPVVLEAYQRYIPAVLAKSVTVIVNELPSDEGYPITHCLKHLQEYFDHSGTWYPATLEIKNALMEHHTEALHEVNFSERVWEKSWVYDEKTN
ncbi:glycosyltransferase family 2 protein [Oceanobacillus polygoni]|uniref:Glycosyltransferase involved in cell wall biosynthesis n=1 Tax=Oceanobacillus polygoni TaxID=1235259 RepID=A0A9X1CEG5_9BACI|nr:glycosyltransferase family 2 protein [Oceanobacillus polygoni]MBP2076168.1 glycosyltransferase involved in cell wall biosynthesis [Oceanobacillus polygoni]